MKRVSLLLCITLSLGMAEDIDTLIQKAYDNSFALKAMQSDIQINRESVKSSASWDNPVLSAGLTDLRLDDISDRTLEPMQTQFIALSQSIPLRGKKGILKEISKDAVVLSQMRKKEQKAMIASQITMLAYKHEINQKHLDLIDDNRKNLKTIKKLLGAYQKSEESRLGVDVKLLQLENRRQNLQYQQALIKANIEKFTVDPVGSIDTSLALAEMPLIDIINHPKIKLLAQKIELLQNKSDLAEAKMTPDLKISGGYYQRENRDDYLNLSFSMPLPVRGAEKVETAKAKLAVLSSRMRLKELKHNFEKEVTVLQRRLETSAQNYKRYTDKLLPKQKKITRYLKTKNRIGDVSLTDVLQSINQSITLETFALRELEHYFEAYAKLRYYR